MGVRTNADTPADARTARRFGAEGIGLCRTEHMFFDGERIVAVREMIMADDVEGRRARARQAAADAARATSSSSSASWRGLPVTIRLLDPPLHEFLPKTEAEMQDVAQRHRQGCRGDAPARARRCTKPTRCSAIAAAASASPAPEIYEMQARAIFEAAVAGDAAKPAQTVEPEIMIPLVATKTELDVLKEMIDRRRRRGDARDRRGRRLHGRHHDRAAARRAARRRDRRDRRVLQLRHQRPDADHASACRATMPAASSVPI